MILVSEPYYNEPGHQIITANTQSTSYNNHIKLGTVRWAILDAIRRPSPSFKDVIKTHFSLKQHEILETCKKWCDENAAINVSYLLEVLLLFIFKLINFFHQRPITVN